MLNIPVQYPTINNIIKSYFNLFFKDNDFVYKNRFLVKNQLSKLNSLKRRSKFFKIKRSLLKRIYTSNTEIKYNNNKIIITLYIVDKEKKILEKKFLEIRKKVNSNLLRYFFFIYKKNLLHIYKIFNNYKKMYIFSTNFFNKKEYILFKLSSLNKLKKIKSLYIEKIWGKFIKKYTYSYLILLRKYNLLYNLNKYKINQSLFLPKLNNILSKITNKRIEYNVVNLKSITYNSDIFTNILSLKLRKRKRNNHIRNMLSILNKTRLPNLDKFKKKSIFLDIKMNSNHINKYKDLKLISFLKRNSLEGLLYSYNNLEKSKYSIYNNNNLKRIHKIIFENIKYKNLGGIRLEVKGRLTKRYRADRSISSSKWKGGLRDIDSSFKNLSSVLFRGNQKSNVSYSLSSSKRRIGAFAVKGWINGI